MADFIHASRAMMETVTAWASIAPYLPRRSSNLPGVCDKLPRAGLHRLSRRWELDAVSGISNQRSNGTSLAELSADGTSGAVAEPVAWELWASQSSGLLFGTAGRKSGAGAGGAYATGEHTSGVEASRRGVEPVKFGCDWLGYYFNLHLLLKKNKFNTITIC
jgi:hypothetical protein